MAGDVVAELLHRRHVAVGRDALGFEIRHSELQMHRVALDEPGRMRLAAGMREGGPRPGGPKREREDDERVEEPCEALHGLASATGLPASAPFSDWLFSYASA